MERNLDTKDQLVLLDQFGPELTRCVGGRLVAVGWSCPHCTSMEPSSECAAPKKGYKRAAKKAAREGQTP